MKSNGMPYVSINPYSKVAYIYKKDILRRFNLSKASKKNFYISFLNVKDFILTTIKISKNILDEDLKDVIESRTYEELDLDQTIEYKIDYIEVPTLPTEKERVFHVFVAEPETIEKIFEQIIKETKFIDYIIPFPLLFKTLYTNNILDFSETHLFIYFQKEDASLTIYKDGNLIYTKSLKYSFEDIAQKISEMASKDISVEEVIQDLSKEGLKTSDFDKLNYYMKIFSELFMHINEVLIYAKRANNIEKIDKIFIDSEFGFIRGLEEYAVTYFAQEAYNFSFDFSIESNESFVEQIHYFLISTARDIVEKEIEYPNFTIFPRPKPLFKRPTGKLILVIFSGILFGLSYPAYNYILGYKYKYEAMLLEKEFQRIHLKRVTIETQINRLKKELEEIKKKVEAKELEFKKEMSILEAIYDKKVNYILKSVTLADLSKDLIKHKILVTNIDVNHTTFNFDVTSEDDKAITKFIKYIMHNKNKKYDVSIEKIQKPEDNSSLYFSNIKVDTK